MEVNADDGFWKLLEHPCVAVGHAIAFNEAGTIIYAGHLRGMAATITANKANTVGQVWLNPLDAKLFVGWAAAKGHHPVGVQ